MLENNLTEIEDACKICKYFEKELLLCGYPLPKPGERIYPKPPVNCPLKAEE